MNTVNIALTICTNTTDIKIFFPIFIFSFLSSKLYLGLIINMLTKNTKIVNKHSTPPLTPNFMTFPNSVAITIPISGTEEEKHAPNIPILNNENPVPTPTNESIKEIIYNIILFLFINSDHLFEVSCFLSCSIYSFIF